MTLQQHMPGEHSYPGVMHDCLGSLGLDRLRLGTERERLETCKCSPRCRSDRLLQDEELCF